jgi:DNA-binding CsgD family transcriptional regulator
MTPRSPRGPPLVERQRDLERLADALEQAASGRPWVTVVAGEAGIGKTRLVRALEELARERHAVVLRGDCLRLEGGELPFAPLAAALREVPRDVLERLPRAVRVELGMAFPQLAREGHVPADSPESDRHAQRRLFDSLLCLLSEIGEQGPVVLIIEDFHWVDRATRDFIGFLARGGRRDRILTVITYREHDDASPATVEMLADLERIEHVDHMHLRTLSRTGVGELAQGVLGGRPASLLLDRIYYRSRGNPFFAEELLAAHLEGRDEALPAGVANAVLQRLRRMSVSGQQLLRLVAATRRPAPLELVTATCGLAPCELNGALREALAHHLLVEDGPEPTYAFRHELMREAVYATLHAGERRQLHAVIATQLAGAGGSARAELAFHWRAAHRSPEALIASLEAGLEAERSRAYSAAADDFRAAADLWDELGDAPDGTPFDRAELDARLADALKHAGDYGAAVQVCERVLEAVDPSEDPARAAAFHERLGALRSSHSEVALASFRRASALVPTGDRITRARLIAEEADALLGLDRWQEAAARAEEALSLALEAGTTGEALVARTVYGLALASNGRFKEGDECLQAALETPVEQALPDDLLRAYLYLAELRRLRGRFDTARTTMQEGARLAHELGLQGAFGWYMAVNEAADLFHMGRLDDADRRLDAVRGRSLESWTEILLRQVAGQIALLRGHVEEAESELLLARGRCGDAQPECAPPVYAALAELALWRGDSGAARAHVTDGFAAVEATAELLYTPALHAIGARAEADAAARAMDDHRPDVAHLAHEAALTLVEDLAERLRQRGGENPPPLAVAHLAAARSEVLRAAAELSRIQAGEHGEDWMRAASAWAEAAKRWEDVSAPYPAAYACWRRAEAILMGQGRGAEATALLRQAYGEAGKIGARLLEAAIEVSAARVRVDLTPPATPVARPESPAGLTPREEQILALLARGLTNREIATELVISTRTVEVHVARVMAKLSAHTRTEAVAAAHRMGLVGELPTGARR